MNLRSTLRVMIALSLLWLAPAAYAQAPLLAMALPSTKISNETDLRNVLVWNSPWEGRAAAPGRAYSYRTVFLVRRDTVVAEVVSYATNQRSDSVVTIRDGRLSWQDANGADVTVALADGGDLVGNAIQQNNNLPIVLKPRP